VVGRRLLTLPLVLTAVAGSAGCLAGDGDEHDRSSAGPPGPRLDAARAPFAPRLRVEQSPFLPGRPTSIVIELTQQPHEPAVDRATIVVPDGFRLDATAEKLGEVEAAVDGPSGGERVLVGPLAKSDGVGRGCVDGPATELAARLSTTGAGSDGVTVAAALHRHDGETRLTLCPRAGSSLSGAATLRRLTVRLARAQTPPGIRDTVWRGLFAAAGGDGRPVESRALVPVPSFLTLASAGGAAVRAEVRAGSRVRLGGYLLQVDPQQGRSVRISARIGTGDPEVIARARTGPNGAYAFTFAAPATPGVVELTARVQSLERPCTPGAGTSCSTTIVSGVSSPPLRLIVRR
jgi:hypothetical protein